MKAIRIDAAGAHEIEAPADMVESMVESEAKRIMAGADTPAMIRLRERIAARGDAIQPVIIECEDGDGEAETWYVKKLSYDDVHLVSFAMGAEGYSLLDLRTMEANRAFAHALVYAGTCKGEDDPGRFFANPAEVQLWAAEPGCEVVVRCLFGGVLHLNPEFIPAPAKKAVAELAGGNATPGL